MTDQSTSTGQDDYNNCEAWLDTYFEHADDFEWLDVHHDQIRQAIHKCILDEKVRQRRHKALRALFSIMPYVLSYLEELDKWQVELLQALDIVRDDPDYGRSVSDVWAQIASLQKTKGTFKQATMSSTIALRWAKDEENHGILVDIYSTLLDLNSYYQGTSVNDHWKTEALALAEIVDDKALKARMYHAIAAAHIASIDRENVILFGKMALELWEELDNTEQFARAADVIASVCMVGDDNSALDTARHYLDIAADAYAKTAYPYQYVRMNYMRGVTYLREEMYPEAQQWLYKSYLDYGKLAHRDRYRYLLGGIYQALAIVHIKLMDSGDGQSLEHGEQAEIYLSQAAPICNAMQDHHQRASIKNDMGIIALWRRNFEAARELFQDGLAILKEHKQDNLRWDELEQRLKDNLDQTYQP